MTNQLFKIARAISEFDSPRVIVTGHTDSTGNDALNQQLSDDRARKVGDFPYSYPVVDVAHYYLWPVEPKLPPRYRDPWWYDPWWYDPWWYDPWYPYPYRY